MVIFNSYVKLPEGNTNQRKFQTFKIRGFAGGDNSFTGALGRINTFGVELAQDIASGHRTWQWRISHLDPMNFSHQDISKAPFFCGGFPSGKIQCLMTLKARYASVAPARS